MALHRGLTTRRAGCSPCTRRDGPHSDAKTYATAEFSLHAQGWPEGITRFPTGAIVLPARAGMARRHGWRTPRMASFSLHAQGWPEDGTRFRHFRVVLPARAGMARTWTTFTHHIVSSPCTRRDGPSHSFPSTINFKFCLYAQGSAVCIRDRVLFKSVLVYRHRQSGIACPNLGILRSFWLRTYGCREGK